MRRTLRARRAVSRTAGAAAVLALALGGCAEGGGGDTTLPGFDIENVGFMTPESVLVDTIADVYLVSNVNGGATDKDDNGFISRVSPDGEVLDLKWIDGQATPADLHAPKGMAIKGDSLFVADIDCVRIFNRNSGEAIERICIDGATFLNDVAVGEEGSLYVTDSGLDGNFEPTGTDAIYRFALIEGGQNATIAKGPDLGGPNGVAIGSRGIFVTTFRSGEIIRYTVNGDPPFPVSSASDQQLDGIVFLNDGGFAYSSWGDSTVYHASLTTGVFQPLLTGVESPADIGYDPRRNRILVPLFLQDKVLVRELGGPADGEGG